MIVDVSILLSDFEKVARLAGFDFDKGLITYEALSFPHKPSNLPHGKQAVYIFSLPKPSQVVLKAGKVGPNSNARFLSHHYNPNSSGSNLAKSLLEYPNSWKELGIDSIDEKTVGAWVRQNTDRENLYLNSIHGMPLLSLLEIFLQCRLNPLFEG
jgi:hypothetical protein